MTILGWLTGLPLGGIASALKDAYVAHETAQTDATKIAAQERVSALTAQQSVLTAEAGNRVNALFRVLLSLPAVAYIWKLIVVDKLVCPVLGQSCSTDDLSANLWYYVMLVCGFYLLHWTVGAWRSNNA